VGDVQQSEDGSVAIYVYGVASSDVDLPVDLIGLQNQRVELVERDALVALVGPVSSAVTLGRREHIMAHTAVLDRLIDSADVIPARFGTVLEDLDAVQRFLATRDDRLRTILRDLAGCFQFVLRAQYDEEVVLREIVAEEPDIARLRNETRDLPEEASYSARLRQGELVAQALERKRAKDVDAVLEVVGPHAVSFTHYDGGGPDHLLAMALLVRRSQRAVFEEAAEEAAEDLAGRAVLSLTGPMPAYDFMDEG